MIKVDRDGYLPRPSKTRKKQKRSVIRKDDTRDWLTADFTIGAVSISSSFFTLANPLDPLLLGTSGFFPTFPQVMKPFMAGTSALDFRGRIRVKELLATLNFVGSQGSTVSSGDLYNRVRVQTFWTRVPYLDSPTYNALTIDNQPDTRDIVVLDDRVINLATQAFDTVSNFNVPDCKTVKLRIHINRDFDCFSAGNGATWNTRMGNLEIRVVSDSAVAPNPSVSGSTRLLYKIVG